MACALYILVKFLRGANDVFPYDTEVFCALLAIELPAYLNTWRLWRLTLK
jgi:hypothetical protein